MDKIKEIEKFWNLQREIMDLELKIEKCSMYSLEDMGKVWAKLMTAYEGVDYIYKKGDFLFEGFRLEEKEPCQFSITNN